MIKFGGLELKTSRPSDLDAQLITTTGCGVKELDTILGAGPDRAARALLPFLDKEAPAFGELARAIAGDPGALPAIRKLYADGSAASVPATGDAK
jgi:hypothetical protein